MNLPKQLSKIRTKVDPVEVYLYWEYYFLKEGFVSSPKEFAELPIPCILDWIQIISEETKKLERVKDGITFDSR